MDITQILDELSDTEKLPLEALRAADADRAAAVPVFLRVIEDFISAGPEDRTEPSPLFFILHLLAAWRETSAYRPIIRLLRCPPEEVEQVLGDAITETLDRIIASVFDGDPQPVYELILDPMADQFVRGQMCTALAIAVLNGKLPRDEAARFLESCATDLQPQSDSYVWSGWSEAIAGLGLTRLRPLVKQAFDRPCLDPFYATFDDFEQDLTDAIAHPDAPPRLDCSLIGDPIEELSEWPIFAERREEHPKPYSSWDRAPRQAINPFKNVGRNDPCPCGSGMKFKKCCLNKRPSDIFDERAA